ncbi:MAG: ABC transporter permease, partial [Anaerolineae bacterium]|nr:ABC transporter permease [Anaerolineae bacterium]
MLYSSPRLAPISLALRNLKARLGRTLLTSLGISLGVAVVLAIQTTNQSTLDSIDRVFDRAAGQANLLVVPNSLMNGTGESLDADLLPRMQNAEHVEVASATLRTQTLLASEAKDWEISFGAVGFASGSVLELYGVDPQVDPNLRVYILTQGRMPKDGAYEVALPGDYAEEKQLELGGDLVILIPDGSASLEIVGLLESEGVGLLNSGAVAFAPLTVVQDLFSRRGEIDEIALKISPDMARDADALEMVKEKLELRTGRNTRVIFPAARGQLVSRMLGSYQQGLSFFSLIAVFVGTFLIYNTFSMTVVERTHEIGMLRAIGMGRGQVLGLVLVEALLLAVLGSLAGLFLGLLLAKGLMFALGAFLSTGENVLTVPAQGFLQSMAVGIMVTLTAALVPAIQAARISPLEALRVQGRTGEKMRPVVWISGLVLLFTGFAANYGIAFRPEVRFTITTVTVLFILLGATLTVPLAVSGLGQFTNQVSQAIYGNEGRIGAANMRRSIGRTTLTVASLIVALAMIVGISSLSASVKKDFTAWIDASIGGDLYVQSPVRMRESFGRQLASVPGVEMVSPARMTVARIAPRSLPSGAGEDDTIFFNAIEVESFRQVSEMQFVAGQGDPEENWARLAAGNAVYISSVISESHGLQQGDTLYLLTRRGERPFYIAGVVVDFFAQGQSLTGTFKDMKTWFAQSGVDRFTVKVSDQYSMEAVSAEIEERYQSKRSISVQTTQAFKTQIQTMIDQSLSLFDVLSLIGVVIGTLGVVNTLTMNVLERTR